MTDHDSVSQLLSANRPRAYSNSSSSSSSSHITSPTSSVAPWSNNTSSNATTTLNSNINLPVNTNKRGNSGTPNTSEINKSKILNSKQQQQQQHHGQSNISNVQISHTVRPPGSNSSPILSSPSFRPAHGASREKAQLNQQSGAMNNFHQTPHDSFNNKSKPKTKPNKGKTITTTSLVNGTNNINSSYSSTASGPVHFYKPPPPSAVAASASAAAFAAATKPKESALSKAKMFALQATKPHLSSSGGLQSIKSSSSSSSQKRKADLTIQTMPLPPGRPSFSERSPLSRPSKELERIASIPPQNVIMSPMIINPSRDGEKHKSHYHLSFRSGKNTHSTTVLSSSSSNSKLVSEQGSIYSFHPSSPGGIHKSFSALELKSLSTPSKEEKDYIADESWALLRSRVLPLFQGEGLRVPVEDLNDLVTMHLNFKIQQQNIQAHDIIQEFKDLTKLGMQKLNNSLQKASNDSKLILRLVELWQFFFSQVLPYWEAVFLPLQLEFEGSGHTLSPQMARDYWATLHENPELLSTRRMTLLGFRDWVIIPHIDKLQQQIQSAPHLDFNTASTSTSARTGSDTAVRLFQCISLLVSIHSNDEKQARIESLVKTLKQSWLFCSRTAKDRRGIIAAKSKAPTENTNHKVINSNTSSPLPPPGSFTPHRFSPRSTN